MPLSSPLTQMQPIPEDRAPSREHKMEEAPGHGMTGPGLHVTPLAMREQSTARCFCLAWDLKALCDN